MVVRHEDGEGGAIGDANVRKIEVCLWLWGVGGCIMFKWLTVDPSPHKY